ncbi:MAG: aminotransferase class V-fold PLP-dependent enzyme [Cyclobacteriaceae bacterium]|nr:aminotransferase class V-fold PLP-dependent enzyme [Cyclobacteriaceae bacterium]
MKRRDHLKNLALLPLAGTLFPFHAGFANSKETSFDLKDEPGNIFRALGVEPIINCRGTFTIIGGSIERPEVRAAMEAASQNFIQYDELADGIGQKLAELTGAEWGMVSAGCAAGLKHLTAACVTGGNPEKLIRIPNLAGFDKTEVVIPRHSRNAYDHAIRNIGVTVITVDTIEELEKALNSRTAMIYVMAYGATQPGQPMSTEAIVKIAKPKHIPVIVDAAAEVLTIPNVHLKQGASVVAYSGGKAICGPQCAGLLLGQKDILMSAWQASSPHHGPGRDNKVGREEMMGMLAAVETWKKRDHEAEWKTWLTWLSAISKKVTAIKGVTASIFEPTELSNKSPVLNIMWDPTKFNLTGEEVAEICGRTKPRIALGSETNEKMTSIQITTGQMQPGDDTVVGDRLFEILSKKYNTRTAMANPSGNITGRWEVTIEFFNSVSNHVLDLEQDGNWIQGSHQGDFTVRDLVGTLEADQIILRSIERADGDYVPFIFSAILKDGGFAGQIYMGEYRTAKFSAKKYKFKGRREKIVVPSGPPLAT